MMLNLPEHNPNDAVWQGIEAKLNERSLQEAIGKLPLHEPTESVWRGIESQLNPPAKIVRLHPWEWASIAAAILVVFGLYFFGVSSGDVQFTQEKIDKNLFVSQTDDSQKQYEMIVAYCEQENIACESPEFKALRNELEELNTASQTLQQAMGNYNTETYLMAQLTAIEEQKATVLRKIAQKI